MRLLALVVLAGCGRLGFDVDVSDAGGDGPRGDSADVPVTRLMCGGTRSDLAAVPTDADLVASVLGDAIGVGWIDRQQQSVPQFAMLDANLQITGPIVASPMNTGIVLNAIMRLGNELYIDSSDGSPLHIVTLADLGFANVRSFDTGQGVIGRDCVLSDLEGFHGVGVIAEDTTMYASYPANGEFGVEVIRDIGEPIASIACFAALGHAHSIWSSTGGVCGMIDVLMPVGLTPDFGGEYGISNDCVDPRATVVAPETDSMAAVWRTTAGAIRAVYGETVRGPEVMLAPAGRSPRVSSDGERIWYAWLDTRTGSDELRVGHALPDMELTDEIVVPVTPAGTESYELVSLNGTVYLLVITADGTPGLLAYELCASA